MAAIVTIPAPLANQTLAAIVRTLQPGLSWSQAQRAIETRRVKINDELCMDPARRVKVGDVVELLEHSAKPPAAISRDIVIRQLDEHIAVVEKPSGINTVRHPLEKDWTKERRDLSPTLEDLTQGTIAARLHVPRHKLPRLRKVHRLDKLTSGLVVFARSALAERDLGKQFADHSVIRRYIAVVNGIVMPQTIRSTLVRDRGDGRRGSSTSLPGKHAVTHVEVLERLPQHTVLSCRLETGRTHQIRIHLSELGHPVCGDPVYVLKTDGSRVEDLSGAPRLALHAAELGFRHPGHGGDVHWMMELPGDLKTMIERLRSPKVRPGSASES